MATRETERLLLRPWEDEDLDDLARICAQPEVMRYIGAGVPLTRRESAAQLHALRRHWDEHGFGLWAAVEKSSGAVVGWTGLARPAFLPAVMPAVEVGWRLDRAWWGRGLATEAGRESLRHAFGDLGLDEVVSIIHPENAPSRRVAEKIGLTPEREETHPRHRIRLVVYRGLAPAA